MSSEVTLEKRPYPKQDTKNDYMEDDSSMEEGEVYPPNLKRKLEVEKEDQPPL